MNKSNTKLAFEYESGQYICHTFIEIKNDEPRTSVILDDFIKLVQDNPTNHKQPPWLPVITNQVEDDQTDRQSFHITVLRGHHAVYYHQIRPFVTNLTENCRELDCFKIFLDRLVIFENYEKTKRFLCLASHLPNASFVKLRTCVQSTLNDFASELTQECNIDQVTPHCSFMWQDINKQEDLCDKQVELNRLNELLDKSSLGDIAVNVNVESVTAKIGFKTYEIPLYGS